MKTLKKQLTDGIQKALESLSYPGKDFSLAPPNNPDFGNISSNIALLLANDLKTSPLEIANAIANELQLAVLDHIESITVTPPGFINFFIRNSFFQSSVKSIRKAGNSYGRGIVGRGKTANVEFVSANPTGPLTVGHGRNAVLGDSIANILEWNSYEVTREYYYNDAGRQMHILGQSVEARYFELCGRKSNFPEEGYQGEYIREIARQILDRRGTELGSGSHYFKDDAEKEIFSDIKNSLKRLGIHFDHFANEKTFYENGAIDQFIMELKKKDLIYEKDGATWFRATALGKEKDRVYIKTSGEPTYRVPDTAYHRDKLERKFDLIVDIFGADHADSYPDVLLALQAMGLDTSPIKVLLYQFVTLMRDGQKVRMSTRKANFVTLDELKNDLGADVVRYFFIMRSMNTHLDFDLDLAADQSDKNPVFYLQYAHARICNIIKHGQEKGIKETSSFQDVQLTHEDELNLIRHMVHFPELIETAHDTLEPQNIANYLQELAARFHRFYGQCRVITKNKELSKARLGLVSAVKIILGNGLSILGITAPERM
ncbi:uncharacterized protein METZ01_LOCUS34496 [marine metagenome]|uniref:arginine--tRNA ligase n=1 Tax=marine metagenome TaxID=408172 RepID=A0A381QQK5_9ZZZZ